MIRRLILAAALTAGSVAVAVAPAEAAMCGRHYTCNVTYYSDASKTTVVGEAFYDCMSRLTLTGTRTAYYTNISTPCD